MKSSKTFLFLNLKIFCFGLMLISVFTFTAMVFNRLCHSRSVMAPFSAMKLTSTMHHNLLLWQSPMGLTGYSAVIQPQGQGLWCIMEDAVLPGSMVSIEDSEHEGARTTTPRRCNITQVDNGLAQTQVFYLEIFLIEDYAEVDIFPPWKIDKIPFSKRNIFHLKFVNQFLY